MERTPEERRGDAQRFREWERSGGALRADPPRIKGASSLGVAAFIFFLIVCIFGSQAKAASVPYSIDTYVGTGSQTAFSITFPYISQADLTVTVNGITKVAGTDFTFTTASTITFTTAPPNAQAVVIQRFTNLASQNVVFTGGALSSQALNLQAQQFLYGLQERYDQQTLDLNLGALVAAPLGLTVGSTSPSTNWFADQGGVYSRVQDRLLVGAAVTNAQTSTNNYGDWLNTLVEGRGGPSNTPTSIAQVVILTNESQHSAIGAVEGADAAPLAYAAAMIGNADWCIGRNATYIVGCFGGYDETWLDSAVSGDYVVGRETDVVALVSVAAPTPYTTDLAAGIRSACGGGYSAIGQFNCGDAFIPNANPMKWDGGLDCLSGALVTQASGFQYCVKMAQGGAIQEWTSTNSLGSTTIYNTHTAADAIVQLFNDTGYFLKNPGGSTLWFMDLSGDTSTTGAGTFGTGVTATTGAITASAGPVSGTYVAGAATIYTGLSTADPSPAVGHHLVISDASACIVNTAVSAGGGTIHSCAVVYNGSNWIAEVTH